ncbi:MAG: hypothetical protein DWH70_07785 [Planctomycetota bacterium]|nr:MAG: hypothetical protein DWH70_07785 [Planctomycetota bacterium]
MSLQFFRKIFNLDLSEKGSRKGRSRRLELLGLEERIVPATYTVLNASDSGAGSLRQAILDANATADNDTIDFSVVNSTYSITLATALPSIATTSTSGTLTITGLGASSLTIDANKGNFSIFTINTGGDLTISGVTVSRANISGNGGAFNNSGNLTISNSTLSGNFASNGGGIFNNVSGTATITNSTISGNSGGYGGGINNSGTLTVNNSTISGNSISNQGSGIYNNNNASLTVTNSTISGNSAGFAGGGIYNNTGILTLSNSTLTGNSAYLGGALYNRGGSTATVTNSTFSGNTATRLGGGGGIYNSDILNIANTIIANSTKGGDYNGGGTVNLISPSTAANNLVSSGSFSWATTKTSSEINLGPLANNGGPTKTIALGTGSVAIGAGDATISNAAPVNGLDQRGVTRSTTAPSIGAFEFYPATQVTLTTTAAGSASGSAFTTQPVITIRDSLGNPVNTTASVTMTVSGNGTTVGTTTVNAVNGIATFTNVGISGTAGTAYTLTFTSGSLTTATQSITPTFGTATQATLSTNAAGSASGSAFTTQPVITIKDSFGNTVTNSTASVTMTVSGNGTTVGTTTVNAVAGIATFTDVGISGTAGTAYTLTFASNGLTSATQSITPLGAANTPAFGAPTATTDGFTVLITNYDPNSAYAGTATANGTVAISSNGLVTVSGVAANTSSTATITTTQTNYVSGSAQVTATALAPTPTPSPTPTPTAPLVVGTPPPTSSGGSSTVTLYDPVTGAEAGTAVPFPGFSGPVKVVSGDFNNDGVADIIAGAGFGGGPAIAILDSATGEVMEAFFAFDEAFTGGVFVAVQDVNGDGILDIIAGAGPTGGPEVRIFDGANLNVLRSFYAYAEDFTGGVSVASIDFNNDGILDLVTGAGPGGAPHVKVYDGATNAIISQWYAYPVAFTGGVFVAVGDIGNDNTFEVVTGAGQGGIPVVAVWDPFTGALLAQFMAYAEDFTGGVRVGINDGNNDGIADILTGAGPGGGPQVNFFNFPALDLLFSFYSGDPANTGGVFVS